MHSSPIGIHLPNLALLVTHPLRGTLLHVCGLLKYSVHRAHCKVLPLGGLHTDTEKSVSIRVLAAQVDDSRRGVPGFASPDLGCEAILALRMHERRTAKGGWHASLRRQVDRLELVFLDQLWSGAKSAMLGCGEVIGP
ncbi:hypothetical protein BKA70DRAFT_582433 [Coprinopsis sp. MPI-PUGE-AT-0042]|nr:hypothetical protein BKA70DRAFT_582433 [Coprinopsis sp. MPI-PUGE-AT-0042]